MKLLLDENLPKKLKLDLDGYDVFTVRDMDWNGKKNGELLQLMLAHGFDALLTFDKNLQYQQNFKIYSLPVIVLCAEKNTYLVLKQLIDNVKKVLQSELLPGSIIIKEA